MTRSAAVLLRDAGVLCRVLDVGIGRRRCASDRRPRARSGKKGRARGRRFGGARRITRRGRAGARGRRDARQRSDRAGEGEASGSSVVHPAESCKARASRQRGLARGRPSLREEAAEPSTHPFNSRFENWPLAVRESQDAPRSAQRSNVRHASRRTWTSRAPLVPRPWAQLIGRSLASMLLGARTTCRRRAQCPKTKQQATSLSSRRRAGWVRVRASPRLRRRGRGPDPGDSRYQGSGFDEVWKRLGHESGRTDDELMVVVGLDGRYFFSSWFPR